jgi:hypothetical protein
VRVDIIRVYHVDIIIKDDAEKFGRDRVQQMAVGHPAISADFFDVMDLDPGTGVVIRIGRRPAVCDLVLFRSSKRRQRGVIPESLLCVTRSIGRVLAERGKLELLIHRRHPGAKVMAWNGAACGSKKPHDAARGTPCQ